MALSFAFADFAPAAPSAPDASASSPSPSAAATPGDRVAGDASGGYSSEQRAEELYLDAMEKLEAGHRDWAQKTLETLIARFPQSTAAGMARHQLGTLYRRHVPLSEPEPAGLPQTAPAPSVSVPAPAVSASPAWEQELRRNAPIQARLRNEVGDRVFFAAGTAELGSRARAALTAQAQWLNRWHEFEAAIEGHADEPGSEEENLKLSVARAEVVRRRLVEEGVDASRLAVVGQGRTQRIATCAGVDCAAQNRRTVTLVFASGTRERLGLTAPPPLPASEEPAARVVEPAPDTDAAVPPERVGVAR